MKQISIFSLAVILAATVLTTGKIVSQMKNPLHNLLMIQKKLDDIKMTMEENTNRDKTTATTDLGLCGTSEPKGYIKNRENQDKTTLDMLVSQSLYFAKLSGPQQDAFIDASYTNGYSTVQNCPLETLTRCNADMDAIHNCGKTDTGSFIECLTPKCLNCTCALTSLLGLDCFRMRMVRLIRSNSDFKFGNVLLTPYVDRKDDDIFKTRLYMNYEGVLVQDTSEGKLAENFENHKKYWERKYGPIRSKKQAEEIDTVKTVIETANSLLDVIDKTKTIVLGDLDEQISNIKLDIKGITDESRTLIQQALSELYSAEVDIARTRGVLESLARETIQQVDSLIYYLAKVSDDWPAEKIAKFLRFQSKKMAELTDRSMDLLEDADKLYQDIQHRLANIQSKLEAFKKSTAILLDESSEGFKKRIKNIRIAVYLPCCIPSLGLACPICAAILEREISKWKDELHKLQSTISKNGAVTGSIVADVKETQSSLAKEVQSLIQWGAALTATARIDYEFGEAEIFGFADVRPQVVQTLENLKTAADNYLANNFGKSD